jgi:phasin family protein
MTQASKKASGAKLASTVANKATRHTMAAVESTRNSAEHVVKIGSNAVKEILTSSAGEAKKAHDKAFAMSRENAEQIAKSADAVTKVLYEAIGISRENLEACVECGNMTAALAKDLSGEAFEAANKALSEHLEISKDFFACRTINDMMELHSKVVKHAIDSFFSQSVKLSGLLFEYTTETLEPINERVAHATEQFSKVLAA